MVAVGENRSREPAQTVRPRTLPQRNRSHRWPAVPFFASVAGDVLGFLIIFCVYKENTFASATIEVYPDQKVISSGLYALVRHPMYTGGFVMFVGAALSLGSWWGLFAFLLMMPGLYGESLRRKDFVKEFAGLCGV